MIVHCSYSWMAFRTKKKRRTEANNRYTVLVRTVWLASFQNCRASCSSSTIQRFDLLGYFNGSKIPWASLWLCTTPEMPPFSKTINIADIIPKNFRQGSGVTQPVRFLVNETSLIVFNGQSPSEKSYWQYIAPVLKSHKF